ncbi:MAG: hypothetical protein IJB96_09405 [Lachnospira sp.]|nr:hypothetical protein [Lachnospira sp.]
MVTGIKSIDSNAKKHQSNQQNTGSNGKAFAKALDEAKENQKSKNITVYTNGYTKNALPFYNFVNIREYNYYG